MKKNEKVFGCGDGSGCEYVLVLVAAAAVVVEGGYLFSSHGRNENNSSAPIALRHL